MEKTLITAKINPDLDGVACIYAYAEFLKSQGEDVVGGVFGKPHVEAQYLIDRFKIVDIDHNPEEDWDKFILVDASDTEGMPTVLRPDDTVEIVDHRNVYEPEKTFPDAKIQNELVGAAATLIAEKFYNSPIKISRNAAILLYGAVFSNTLNLKAKVTTDRDHKAAAWLSEQAEIPEDLVHEMFLAKTSAIKNNLAEVIGSVDFKKFNFGGHTLGIAQLEIVDLVNLVTDCYGEIISILEVAKEKSQLEFVFLTAVDLEKEFNLFVTAGRDTQKLISETLGVQFENNIARRSGLILRKEIIPLLKTALS